MSVMRSLALGLVIASIVFAFATYPTLPDVIPTRLDLGGTPIAHQPRTPVGWFALPAINLILTAVLLGISRALPSRPHLFNFPDKDRFLRLSPAYQAPVIAVMRSVLDVALVGVLLTLISVQALMWRTALGEDAGALKFAPFLGLLLTPVLLLLVLRVQNATEQAEAAQRAAEGERGAPERSRPG